MHRCAHNAAHIVANDARRPSWLAALWPSPLQEVIRRAPGLAVHIMPAAPAQPEKANWRPSLSPSAYAGSFAMCALALGVGLLLRNYLAVSNVALVLLVAVLGSAVAYGLWASLFACLICALAYNFFFLPPLYNFTIADPENILTLVVFSLVAVIASNLTSRMRMQAIMAQERANTTEDLYRFSRKLAGATALDDLLWATAYQIAHMLGLRVVLLLPEGEDLAVRAGYPPEDILDDSDIAAAKWVFQRGTPAGRGADTLPGAKRLFLPMATKRGVIGIIGLDADRAGPLLTPDQQRLLDSLSDQAALAIERIALADEMDKTRLTAETEKLRAALLTSISHDLRTPLASILGSASSLSHYREQLDPETQEDLLRTIREEAERLNRFIANLLDMTRLESGALAPNLGPVEIGDVVGSVLRRAASALADHEISLRLEENLPIVKLDPVLFEQVLFNLLDNAAKYSPPGSTITLRARSAGSVLILDILDEGDGVPEADLENIFDKFYRVQATDRKRAGTGLGLAIGRGFMESMGGTLTAANRMDRAGGAIFTLTIPVPAQ